MGSCAGNRKVRKMIRKLAIKQPDETYDQPVIIPVDIPDMEDVRRLAEELHRKGVAYTGEYKGWPVDYSPADTEEPSEDWMLKKWSNFFIGVWPLWSISFDWENGDDQEPDLLVWDENIVADLEVIERQRILA